MSIYFNLSFWYKLSDQTHWGAIMSAIGAAVMIVVNVLFVPRIGYWACAWGGLAGYGTAMLLSWLIGQKRYPIPYDLRQIAFFVLLAAAFYGLSLLTARLGAAVSGPATDLSAAVPASSPTASACASSAAASGWGLVLQLALNTLLLAAYGFLTLRRSGLLRSLRRR